MSRKRDVGMKIRAAREACGFSQQALADAIGAKSHQNVYNYERGDREPSFEVLERIAAATGKPLAWFFQDDDQAEPAAAAQPPPPPDTHALLAQLVAAQVQMLQAQTRADERQARTDARIERIETYMEAVLDELRAEGQEGCCGHGEGHAKSPGQASGDARRSA